MHQRPPNDFGPPGPPPLTPPPRKTPPKRSSAATFMLAFFGFVFSTVSLPCVVAAIHDVITGADNMVGALIAGTGALMLAIAGIFMLFQVFKKPREEPFQVDRDMERYILALAQQREGQLSAPELAVASDLTVEESQAALEELVRRNAASVHIDDHGTLIYDFPIFRRGAPGPRRSQEELDLEAFDRELASSSDVQFDFDSSEQKQQHQQQHQAHQHTTHKK